MAQRLLTLKQAAEVLGVSYRTVQKLVEEADINPRGSRWRHNKEIIVLSTKDALRRILRINIGAILPELSQ